MKKIRVLAFQKVAKTGNIGKKVQLAGDIDYLRYLSMQKVKKMYGDTHLHHFCIDTVEVAT